MSLVTSSVLLIAAARASPPKIEAVPLSTEGSQIVDAHGIPVRLLSAGMWLDEGVAERMTALADAGFNTVRLDWSNRSIHRLPDLAKVIAAAGRAHLKVILDDHSNESGIAGPWKPCFAQQVNGLWYDRGGASDNTDGCHDPGSVDRAKFVTDWVTVARYFANNKTVIGYDLWNEPSAYPGMSTWEAGATNPDHNIRWMYEQVGNAILAVDPDKLIICMGPMNAKHSFANANDPAPWGDLTLAAKLPVNLRHPHKLVYSVHDYPTEIGGYRPDSGPKKVAQMNKVWGYLVRDGIAPVWIGETGANMTTADHQRWAKTLLDYTNGKLGAEGGPTFQKGQQGVGIDWWFAGYEAYGNPTGIFNAVGKINEVQRATYDQFTTR